MIIFRRKPMFSKLLQGFQVKSAQTRNQQLYRDLLKRESAIGAELFGEIPEGHRREFFCLDEHTWIWFEAWYEQGKERTMTVRYEVRQDSILKAQDGQHYQLVGEQEGKNLLEAARLYSKRVIMDMYLPDPITATA